MAVRCLYIGMLPFPVTVTTGIPALTFICDWHPERGFTSPCVTCFNMADSLIIEDFSRCYPSWIYRGLRSVGLCFHWFSAFTALWWHKAGIVSWCQLARFRLGFPIRKHVVATSDCIVGCRGGWNPSYVSRPGWLKTMVTISIALQCSHWQLWRFGLWDLGFFVDSSCPSDPIWNRHRLAEDVPFQSDRKKWAKSRKHLC